jgi:hypothetical protein
MLFDQGKFSFNGTIYVTHPSKVDWAYMAKSTPLHYLDWKGEAVRI